MKLLCLVCGNYTYFELEVETFKQLNISGDGCLQITNAVFDGFDFTEDSLRTNLKYQIDSIIDQNNSGMVFDANTESYFSALQIQCGRCSSKRVTIPSNNYKKFSLEDELKINREEYKQMRREKINENSLPVLFEP